MPLTELGIWYPDAAADTNLWEHFQDLANSVEAALDAETAAQAAKVATFRYYRAAALAPANATWTLLPLDTEVLDEDADAGGPDVDGLHDNTSEATRSKLTAPVAGVLDLVLQVAYTNSAGGGQRYARIVKGVAPDPASYLDVLSEQSIPGFNGVQRLQCALIGHKMAAGDVVSFVTHQSSGAALGLRGGGETMAFGRFRAT